MAELSDAPVKTLVLLSNPLMRMAVCAVIARDEGLLLVEDSMAESEPSPEVRKHVGLVVADFENGMKVLAGPKGGGHHTQDAGVLIVTPNDRESDVRSALSMGVLGYVLACCAISELRSALRTVARRELYLSHWVGLRMSQSDLTEPLTSRELDVLYLLADGLCNKLIARQMGVAVGTVKTHMRGIFGKLQVTSRAQAILAADRRGLLQKVVMDDVAFASPSYGDMVNAGQSRSGRTHRVAEATA